MLKRWTGNWGGVLLGPLWLWYWLNVARKWSSGSNQRTARLHCPAELSTVEPWTLTLFPHLSLLLSVCTFQRELDRSHTPRTHVTHLLFHEHTDVLYSQVVHVSPLLNMFRQVFLCFFFFVPLLACDTSVLPFYPRWMIAVISIFVGNALYATVAVFIFNYRFFFIWFFLLWIKFEAEWLVAEVQNGIKSTDPKGCIDIIVIACEMLLC